MRHALWTLVLLLGCGDNPGSNTNCSTISDCGDGLHCLSVGQGNATCVADCSVSADACGASASCGPVGSVSIDVCQPAESVADENGGPSEEERVSLPCGSDEECDGLYPGTVCATWMGWKECTAPCSSASTCNPPTVAGMSISFMECAPDEGQPDRSVCLPDEDCLANPLSCIEFDFPG